MATSEFPEIAASIQQELKDQAKHYDSLSDNIQNKLLELKASHPKTIRVVFSRHPKIKDERGILNKIELLRVKKKNVRLSDVNDIIALTILCPYESDIPQIYEWIKVAFDVAPSYEEAVRNSADGHRGYHFNLKLQKHEFRSLPQYRGLTCELQIKTILEEAFDAKSHDLAYKPGNLVVGQELKTQFVHLSSHLRALDGQSEFLKDLILREKREIELRRRACLQVYMCDCGDVPERLGVNLSRLPGLVDLMDILEKQELEPSKELCKFVGYCATSFDNDYLRKLAIDMIERHVEENPADLRRLIGRGAFHWALGNHARALTDMLTIIDDTEGGTSEKAIEINRDAKNNFIYFTCDWQMFSSGVPEDTARKAAEFVKALKAPFAPEELDTLGLYQILFANSVSEIDQGRKQLAASQAQRTTHKDIYQKFFDLHEYIAINRMLKLMTEPAH
jgi:ppGpp synthetase/RelA/SpoT-type nucleotidyltranferase